MLTVNVKETGNENKKEDTLTIHGTTIKEQNGLATDEFKRKKKKEIKKKLENLTKKVKEDAKNKDWESRLPLGNASDYGYSFEELKDMPISSKDSRKCNRASVIFELNYGEKRLLFTGDAD